MISSIGCIALIGTLQFNSAISAAINYEPIKITVNENFNAQPGQESLELQEPGVLHQGANFYFKPQLNLPPSYIPSHIEGLMSLRQQRYHPCSKVVIEKDKLIEILKPFMYPMPQISKERLSEMVLEKENNLEIVKPIIITEKLKPVTPELLVIPKAPELPPLSFKGIPPIVEEEVTKEESVILEDSTGVFPTIPEIAMRPNTETIINYIEPKPATLGLVVIPEAPVLPPLSANDIHVIEEEVKIEEPIVVEVDSKPAIQELVAFPEASVLPSLSHHDISSIIEEEAKKEESVIFEDQVGVFSTIPEIYMRPIEEPIINYVEPKLITSEFVVIPKAPVLPPLSFNSIPPSVGKVKKEESIILEESTGVLPEPTIIEIEPKPFTSELVVIPEAPVLPPLSLHDITTIADEEVKKEESIIFEKPTGMFSLTPELAVRPIPEQIINYVESKPIISELLVIPEAPVIPVLQVLLKVIPPLSFFGIPPIVEEEVEEEESIILESPRDVFPIIPEIDGRAISEPIINYIESKPINAELVVIPEAPVLAPVSANDIHVLEEEVKIEEPIVVDVEPKPVIEELVAISEAPVLYSLSLHDISSMIREEVKKEELVIFEELTRRFPTSPELDVRPIEEPIINYVEPKPITSELVVISEAPVLPPLSFNGIPPIVEEEVEKEESIILEPPTDVFSTIPEIDVRPISEPIINYVESKPIDAELVIIPEAPVVAPLSANDIHVVEEEVKIEEPIVVDVEPKPAIQELVAIPEAPVLASLSFHDISSIMEEEVKIEEPIVVDVEPKPAIQEFVPIPEAPVLPSLSLHDLSSIIEEEVKIEEPIIIGVEPEPAIQELVAIPEAPVLPSLSLHDISSIIEEEMEKEESVILDESSGVFLSIPGISARPETVIVNVEPKAAIEELLAIPEAPVLPLLPDIPVVEEIKLEELEESINVPPPFSEISVRPIGPEPIITYVEPRPITPGHLVIPEVPVLPQLSCNGISPVVEDVKIEESLFEESTGVLPSISEISVRPFPEPLVVPETAESFALKNNIFPIATEEVKIEVPILFEESIGPTLQESEMTDSYVLEEVSQPHPESFVTIKETLPPTIIPKPSNNIGVFRYVPFVSHLSNRAPKPKQLNMFPKPASVERFLLKKYPFRFPVTPFPKHDLNAIKASLWGNKKQHLNCVTHYQS